MGVTYVNVGTTVNNTPTGSIAISCHADTQVGDILVAQLQAKRSGPDYVFTAPDGTWTKIKEGSDSTTFDDNITYSAWWKRATVAGTQSFTFTYSPSTPDSVLGAISNWRGALTTGSPIDATAPAVTPTPDSTGKIVSFPAFDPAANDVHVIYMAFYGDDQLDFSAAMVGNTNPACTLRYTLETPTSDDHGFALTSGDNNGAAIASRTWTGGATQPNASSFGLVFALVAEPTAQGSMFAVF